MPEREDNEDEDEEEETPREARKRKQQKSNNFATVAVVIILILLSGYVYMGVTGNAIFGLGEKKGTVQETIKIGFMGPLSGDAASYGHGIKRGVELALKDSGLTNVEIIYEDTKCEGKEAVNAINKLINIDGVSVIIGEVCSGATLAAAPIAEENQVVMISASSTSPKITDAGDYIFRAIPSDALQGRFAANLVYKMNITNLSILYGNEEYGIGFKDVLKESFEELGGNVTAAESFERGSSDLRTQLTKIRQAKPQAIFIISNSPDSAVAALKQIKQLGMKIKVFGSEGLKGPEVAATKATGEGLIITSVSAGTEEFFEKYYREYGLQPEPFSSQAYDSFTALAETIKKGAKTGTEIKNALYGISFSGVSGEIEFDSDGDVSGNYDVYQLKNGTFVLF
ncbi:penicillin-binding protein activator [Candidatus Pacearchaeota archaeon]|nr:penicillin-binding protein activator [Candidatus Pacearchaeota archaeon]